MLDISSVVLAIVQGASSALASHLMNRRNEPVDIRVVVEQAASELRARDQELAASIEETNEALQYLKATLDHVPELKVQNDDHIVYQPSEDSDLGDVLYRLHEEIEALRRSSTHDVRPDVSTLGLESSGSGSESSDRSILEGLDDEIVSLRLAASGSSRRSERRDA